MPLVPAKCTNCGASLEVDSTKDAAICPYCGAAYIVEKAVSYYNSVNNITAEVVNVYGGNSVDFVIRAGELVKYNGASVDVVIPDNVTMIGENAFENCKGLVRVLIRNGVNLIGSSAFSGCSSLTNIVIPDSVTSVGYNVFNGCKNLVNITLPDGITSIGANAFSGCSSLVDIKIPDSVTSIGGGAFSKCSSLVNIKIPAGVTSIESGVFSGCSSLVSLTMPNSISSIEFCAFEGCSRLSSIKIPTSVTKIGKSAFHKSGLKEVIIPRSVQEIQENAFGRCDNLEKVVLLSRHIDIEEYDYGYDDYSSWETEAAFDSCKKLSEVINGENYSESCFHHTPYAEQCLQLKKQQSNGGCYIATAIYGSYDCNPVWTLRRYRDFVLAKHWYGRIFIRIYYAVSPLLVKHFGHKAWFKRVWKTVLDCMVSKLNAYGIEDTPYKDTNW